MTDIATWLGQQLDKDRAMVERNSGRRGLAEGWPDKGTYYDADYDAAAAYVEHFNPARMLREIAAKRRVLARHRSTTDDDLGWWRGACHGCGQRGEFSDPRVRNVNKCPELRDMASAYEDRPGHKDEWRL